MIFFFLSLGPFFKLFILYWGIANRYHFKRKKKKKKTPFLVLLHGMWGLTSLTRDLTHISYTGSAESEPLDHQGSF